MSVSEAGSEVRYWQGFRVGLGTGDDPIKPLGSPLQTVSAVMRYVDSCGPEWEAGFWDGITEQPVFEEKARQSQEKHTI